MSKINWLGGINIPSSIIEHAETIKFQSYKVNTAAKFQKHTQDTEDSRKMVHDLSLKVGIDESLLEYVYFSVCQGAEEHTDLLDQTIFEDTTFVIPVILPSGSSVITAENEAAEVAVGMIYQFDHTKLHSMVLEDNESGCVVLMFAARKPKRN